MPHARGKTSPSTRSWMYTVYSVEAGSRRRIFRRAKMPHTVLNSAAAMQMVKKLPNRQAYWLGKRAALRAVAVMFSRPAAQWIFAPGNESSKSSSKQHAKNAARARRSETPQCALLQKRQGLLARAHRSCSFRRFKVKRYGGNGRQRKVTTSSKAQQGKSSVSEANLFWTTQKGKLARNKVGRLVVVGEKRQVKYTYLEARFSVYIELIQVKHISSIDYNNSFVKQFKSQVSRPVIYNIAPKKKPR